MAIAVKLESEGAPGGDPEIAETKLFIDEVEVIVEALARIILEKGVSCVLVVPRLVTRTGLHGGKDMDKTDLVSPLFQDLPYALLLPELFDLTDELYLQAALPGNALGVLPYLFPKSAGKARVVEYANALCREKGGHSLVERPAGKCALDDNAVITRKNARNFILIPFCEKHRGLQSLRVFSPTLSCQASGRKPFWFRLVRVREQKIRERIFVNLTDLFIGRPEFPELLHID
jgi:hypothetical protein